MEIRLVEVDRILVHKESEGIFVFQGIRLTENKRRRKKSGPYIRGKSGRYVGELPVVLEGDVLECEVESVNSKKGIWFRVYSAVQKVCASLLLIERFLQRNVPEITQEHLRQILDKYGLDTLQAIQHNPNAFDFAGLLPKSTEELRNALNGMATYEEIIITLQMNGVDCRLAYPVYRKYGLTAPRILQNNPYIPYVDKIDKKYDFHVADKLYLRQGHAPGDPKRCRYAIKAMLDSEAVRHGDLFVRRDCLKEKLMGFLRTEKLPFTDDILEESLNSLKTAGIINIETFLGGEDIYLHSNYMAERAAAEDIARVWLGAKQVDISPADIEAYLSRCEYSLAQKQEEAVMTAIPSPVTIISGGPGTGKTYITKVIVDIISDFRPSAKVQLCAPTGRAAVRISEVTGSGALTIHKMLDLKEYKHANVTPGDLDCDYLIVDEFSMVDMQLCQYLFTAAASKTRVIIVGDPNQLPSVGPGQVLRDMIEAEAVPVVTLSKGFRQDGCNRIIQNAYSIFASEGEKRKLLRANPEKPGEDFYFLEENDSRRIQDKIVEVVKKALHEYHVPLESIAVLTPIHDDSLGTDDLNALLQNKLNPSEEKISCNGREYRLHDKVIHIENDYKLGVYNGEIGFVDEIGDTSENALTIAYPGKRVTYPRKKLDKLDLAYAMTVHKMQGSECRLVIMPVYKNNLGKHILYTAFTRAQRSVVLIGSGEDLLKGLRKQEPDRESNLCKRLQAQILHKTFSLPDAVHPAEPEEPADPYEQQDLFSSALPASKLEGTPS